MRGSMNVCLHISVYIFLYLYTYIYIYMCVCVCVQFLYAGLFDMFLYAYIL